MAGLLDVVAALFPKVLRGETSSSRREAVEAVVEAGPDGGATHRGQLGACIGYLVDQVELAAVGLIGVGVGLCDEPGGASRSGPCRQGPAGSHATVLPTRPRIPPPAFEDLLRELLSVSRDGSLMPHALGRGRCGSPA